MYFIQSNQIHYIQCMYNYTKGVTMLNRGKKLHGKTFIV